AIAISSRLDRPKQIASDPLTVANRFDSAGAADRVTVIDPFTAVAYANRGVVRYWQHDFDGAIADFNAAIRISPRMAEAYLGRGVASRIKGDPDNARADFERAISINSRLAEAYTNRADVRLETGEFDRALKDLNQALALNPLLAETHYQLGRFR